MRSCYDVYGLYAYFGRYAQSKNVFLRKKKKKTPSMDFAEVQGHRGTRQYLYG